MKSERNQPAFSPLDTHLLPRPLLGHRPESLERGRDLAVHELAITTAAVATFLSALGCGGPGPSGASTPSTSPSVPSQSATSTPDAGPSAISTTEPTLLSIGGATHGADGSLLPGVKVCLYRGFSFATDSAGPAALILPDPTACTVSAGDGSFRVSGAHFSDLVILTFHGDGFAPTLRAIATQTDDIALPASENVLMTAPLLFMGTPADPSKGQISFSATVPGAGAGADVSVTATAFGLLTGFEGPSEKPRYLGGDGATAVAATSGAAGGFVNVPSGLYSVRFDGSSTTCTAKTGLYGYPDTGSQAIYVPVLAGYVSAPVGMSCTSAP
jgi:hypothetical protein